MEKIAKIAAIVLSLILSVSIVSYKVRAEDSVWDIQNTLDVSQCRQGDVVILSAYLKGSGTSAQQEITLLSGILEYDNSLFTVGDKDILPIESDRLQSRSFDSTACKFEIKYDSDVTVLNDGLLLQIQLPVAADASTGKTTVCITNLEWSSSDGQQRIEIEHRVPAQITIAEADKISMTGDINLDGRVNLTDAKLIMQHYNGVKILDDMQKENADVNRDGKINLTDAKLVMKFYNGEINGF